MRKIFLDIIGIVLTLIICVGIVSLLLFWICWDAHTKYLDTQCYRILSGNSVDRLDWNYQPISYEYNIFDDRREAKATSPGWDGILGTKDDWTRTKVEYNQIQIPARRFSGKFN